MLFSKTAPSQCSWVQSWWWWCCGVGSHHVIFVLSSRKVLCTGVSSYWEDFGFSLFTNKGCESISSPATLTSKFGGSTKILCPSSLFIATCESGLHYAQFTWFAVYLFSITEPHLAVQTFVFSFFQNSKSGCDQIKISLF